MDAPTCAGCRERDARIAQLEARIRDLESRLRDQERLIKDLAAKLQNRDLPKADAPSESRQSSPSTPPSRHPSGRKPGGQPGHPPHLKQLLPPVRVTQTVVVVPEHCQGCQAPLPTEATLSEPLVRFQVAELPDIKAQIIEYQTHARTCPECGVVTRALLPAAVRRHSIGPGLTALMGHLVGTCGLSKRRVEELVETVFEVPVALGTIAKLEQEMNAALAPAHQEAVAAVRQAHVKGADETGWRKAGCKRWLWVVATHQAVVFLIHRLRNAAVLVHLLGAKVRGTVCTDRWRAYDWLPVMQRQVCWAHLKRNWEKLQERGGKAATIAKACLDIKDQVFALWHSYRRGDLTWSELDDRIAPLILTLLGVLQNGARSRDRRTARFCVRLLSAYPALWTFAAVKGVEPTNNHTERVQRLAVLYRKNCFGCHSDAGCRFVERLLTVVQTLRLQQRPVFQYLREAIIAHRNGLLAPSLLQTG